MLKYFEKLDSFVAAVKKYEKYLSGCFHCGLIWITRQSVTENMIREEDMEDIQKCLVDLNNWSPDVKELAELGIEISHGLCTPCYRLKRTEKNRQEQIDMGFFPCFGTANDGFCSQSGCKWFLACVVDQAELQMWQQKMDAFATMSAVLH